MKVSLARTSLENEPGNCGEKRSWTFSRKELSETVRRLGTILQSIFWVLLGASIRLTVWKWSGESRYPGALALVLENFRHAFSPDPADCPWVSEVKGNLILTRDSYQYYFPENFSCNLKYYESKNFSDSSLHHTFESENFRFPFIY